MPGSASRYTPEFRAEALRLVHSSAKSIVQIAKELRISDSSLHSWLKQSQINDGEREGLTTEEREELRKLRKENKTLRQERDILKKATVGSTGGSNGPGQCSSRSTVAEGLPQPTVELQSDQVSSC